MESEKNLISLKDASKISGYSADYIGQLIRSGKIPGKQVYTGIAWMTTAEAVIAYKNKENSETENESNDIIGKFKRKLNIELQVLKMFFQFIKGNKTVYFLIFLVIILFLLISIFGNRAFDNASLTGQGNSAGEQLTY